MFIDEQQSRSIYDFKPSIREDAALLERYIWSPRSCRHTSWTYQPLVRFDSRGTVIQRNRCPFIIYPQ